MISTDAHTFDVTRLTTRQISQDISFSLCQIGPRFTFCFLNSIIHGAVGSSSFQPKIAMQRAKKLFQKNENPEPPTKLQRLSDKENHVSRHSELLQQHSGDRQSRGEQPLYTPFLSWFGHSWDFFSSFMPPGIVFLLEISVADRKQYPEWYACWCAESRVRWSRKAIQQCALLVSSVERWPITPVANIYIYIYKYK